MTNFERHPLVCVPDAAIEEIRQSYNMEKPQRLDEAVNILKGWLEKQDHILKKDYSREYLEKTLISCKGSIEKTKKQIDKLATFKTLLPKYFTMLNPSKDKIFNSHVKDNTLMAVMPKLTKDLYRVTIMKIIAKHFDEDFNFSCCQFCFTLLEFAKRYDYRNGVTAIYDLRETNILDMVTKLNVVELQQYITILTQGYGTRVKAIYILTESKAVEILLKTMKQFLSEKMASKLQSFSNLESLHKVLDREILPEEYGGDEKSIVTLYDELLDALSTPEQETYMDVMRKACTDETLRSSCKFNEEIMGMPGSFRQLSVD